MKYSGISNSSAKFTWNQGPVGLERYPYFAFVSFRGGGGVQLTDMSPAIRCLCLEHIVAGT